MSAPATPGHNRWRFPALLFSWLDVAACLGAATYLLWNANFQGAAWFDAVSMLLAGLVLAWWTTIFGRVTLGLGVPATDGTLRALAVSYPLLTSLRLVIWGLTLLVILDGTFPTANPVALTAMMTLWGAAIMAANAVNAGLVRLATVTDELVRPQAERLSDWLNLSAALALGMLVINFVPIKGYGTPPTPTMNLVYAAGGLLDLVSALFQFLAVRQLAQHTTPRTPPAPQES
ncbi:hypothetical protein [Deinococcus sp.]|uniref:hypothetical protein n=1 Tax=Deinococcus sp. TaxID=47478 RepID=UPI0025BD9D94|nr:hypothetical protein [Deinococcus sp.]